MLLIRDHIPESLPYPVRRSAKFWPLIVNTPHGLQLPKHSSASDIGAWGLGYPRTAAGKWYLH